MGDDQKSKIAEHLDALTMHGVSRVASSKSMLLKGAWLAICMSVTGMLLHSGHSRFLKHLAYEVRVQETLVTNRQMVFPAITFCNTNYYGEFLQETSLPQSCIKDKNGSNFGSHNDKLHFNKACDMFLTHSNVSYSMLDAISLKFPLYFTAQRNRFPCYTLNGNKELKQATISGPQNGINMILYYNESDIKNECNECSSTPVRYLNKLLYHGKDGLFLVIHDQGSFGKGYSKIGISLPAGYHTSISLKKTVSKRKPFPFPSGCIKPGQERYQKIFPGHHDVQLCLYSCIFLKFYKNCGTVHSAIKFVMGREQFPDTKNLTVEEQQKCLNLLIRDFKESECNCSVPCNQVTYEAEVARKPWPPKWLAKQKLNMFAQALNKTADNITSEEIRENFLKVTIYFDDFATLIREEKEMYGGISLMSDIGGLMGLSLGMSLISLVEMFFLLWEIVKNVFCRKKEVRASSITD